MYILRSIDHPEQRYIGLTQDPNERLRKHNAKGSIHTSKFCPWRMDVVIGFSDRARAAALERYMKSGSGFAFASRHF